MFHITFTRSTSLSNKNISFPDLLWTSTRDLGTRLSFELFSLLQLNISRQVSENKRKALIGQSKKLANQKASLF